jgi:Na+-translocating ferredoxin:NAD+ oxidoreductase RnfC subunit
MKLEFVSTRAKIKRTILNGFPLEEKRLTLMSSKYNNLPNSWRFSISIRRTESAA